MKTLEKLLNLVGTCEVIDMTHPLEEEIPHWPTQPGVKFHTGMNYVEDGSYWMRRYSFASIPIAIRSPVHSFLLCCTGQNMV